MLPLVQKVKLVEGRPFSRAGYCLPAKVLEKRFIFSFKSVSGHTYVITCTVEQ